MREAFCCKPCDVRVVQLTNADIANIIGRLREKNKAVENKVSHPKASLNDGYIPMDPVFKPPVPIPIHDVEINETDHESEFYVFPIFYYLKNSILDSFYQCCIFFLAHMHQIRIMNEHDYAKRN